MVTGVKNTAINAQLETSLIDVKRLDNKAKLIREREKIAEVSRDFESIFMEIVLRSMRKTINKSKLIDGGNAEEIYSSMLDSEYSKIMANRGTSGLASSIEKQLLEAMASKSGKSELNSIKEGIRQYSGKKIGNNKG